MSLFGATMAGVGAIGGGGILALAVVAFATVEPAVERVRRINTANMVDEITGADLQVVVSDDPPHAIIHAAADTDLVLLGLEQGKQKRRLISAIPRGILLETNKAVLLVGQI